MLPRNAVEKSSQPEKASLSRTLAFRLGALGPEPLSQQEPAAEDCIRVLWVKQFPYL